MYPLVNFILYTFLVQYIVVLVAECKMKRMKCLTWALFSLLCLQPFFWDLAMLFFLSAPHHHHRRISAIYPSSLHTGLVARFSQQQKQKCLRSQYTPKINKEIVAFNSFLYSLCICLHRGIGLSSCWQPCSLSSYILWPPDAVDTLSGWSKCSKCQLSHRINRFLRGNFKSLCALTLRATISLPLLVRLLFQELILN